VSHTISGKGNHQSITIFVHKLGSHQLADMYKQQHYVLTHDIWLKSTITGATFPLEASGSSSFLRFSQAIEGLRDKTISNDVLRSGPPIVCPRSPARGTHDLGHIITSQMRVNCLLGNTALPRMSRLTDSQTTSWTTASVLAAANLHIYNIPSQIRHMCQAIPSTTANAT
jgi:hypothetical protein